MAVPFWQPGELIQPGDLRRPTSAGDVTQPQLINGDFEQGDTGWTWGGFGSGTIDQVGPVFDGTWSARAGVDSNPNGQTKTLTNDAEIPVKPGQLATVRAFVYGPHATGDAGRVQMLIQWRNAAGADLEPSRLALDGQMLAGEPRVTTLGLVQYACREIWLPIETRGIAPPGATHFVVRFEFRWGDMPFIVDGVEVIYAAQAEPNRLLFRAVQPASGYTGQSEPEWPDQVGLTVEDNQVTWEAIAPDNVTWEARRILVSGSTEPTWPLSVNGSVRDNTISWVLDPRRVSDERLPQTSKLAAIAASKVFTADDDIVPFSATTNPLDWSAPEDAGYLPFGLQTYGANPITALGLYRGNLVVSNSVGTQIWQVDPDPAAMALLDAIPIGCTFPKTMQPVGNDLAFLTEVGIRNMGTVGAAVNLQAGYFGKPIDELVIKAVKAARAEGREPISTYWPAQGQYWVIFGSEAFVLTVNDGQDGRSWSRYVFPAEIDYATVLGEDLYLRAGELVWRVDESAALDDQRSGQSSLTAGAGSMHDIGFYGFMSAELSEALGGDAQQVGSVSSGAFFGYQLSGLWVEYFFSQYWGVKLVLQGSGSPPPDNAFDAFVLHHAAGTTELRSADAWTSTENLPPNAKIWVWDGTGVQFKEDENYPFDAGRAGTPFSMVLQWPHLDLGALGQEKQLVGVDLVGSGNVSVSIGYDQRSPEFDAVAGPWTPPYEIGDADTLPGGIIPLPVAGPSFALRLEFTGGTEREFIAANVYINDMRVPR